MKAKPASGTVCICKVAVVTDLCSFKTRKTMAGVKSPATMQYTVKQSLLNKF